MFLSPRPEFAARLQAVEQAFAPGFPLSISLDEREPLKSTLLSIFFDSFKERVEVSGDPQDLRGER